MAKTTNSNLRNQIIYQVFPRQHSKQSNFQGVIQDLDRIKSLGVDILYLLPIHPIGEKNKKGKMGCPYSIQDYHLVNPDLGTLEDFKMLIEETHRRGMKLMIDVVFNHTSRDSKILREHSGWMFKRKGAYASKVGDWWDVVDLDYKNKEVWKELISVLKYWAKLGVDGYRCDVASMVPLEFWLEARKELLKMNPEFILFAESIDLNFVKEIRDLGYEASSDCELYQAFDMEYDYDIWKYYDTYLQNREGLNRWLEALQNQESVYPKNYIKVHGLENHDRHRAASYVRDGVRLRNLNALMFFLKGATFIYAGQEACEEKLESLFDLDLTDWSSLGKYNMVDLIKRCSKLKKESILQKGRFQIHFSELEIVHITYQTEKEVMECIFNVGNVGGSIKTILKNGAYINLFNKETIVIENQKLLLQTDPVILKSKI